MNTTEVYRARQRFEGMADKAINEISQSIARSAVHYASELCSLTCAPLLIPLFPNFKEVTESFAAFAAVRHHLPQYSSRDTDVTIVAVGDGSTPRTAATFALRTAWNCWSVDPALSHARLFRNIKRLTVEPSRIEQVRITGDRVIVVAVHSHADLTAAIRAIDADSISVVAIPCCVPQQIDAPPDMEYEDYGCLSPQRTVMVWRSVQGGQS